MNIVATVLLTKPDNPLCPGCGNYRPDVTILQKWLKSLHDCHAVVLHDELSPHHQTLGRQWARVPVEFVQVETDDTNLLFARWAHLRRWLEAHPEVEKVFMTDGSDVEMHRSPWAEMNPGLLYVGSEDDTVSNRWIIDNHPSLRPYAEAYPDETLLNAGLVGGSREALLRFLWDLIQYQHKCQDDLTDMAALNLCVRVEPWSHRMMTGRQVHTKFNGWERPNGQSWFAHK